MISSIFLAAGQSKRMDGENKLCKEIKGIPLIQLSLKGLLGSSIDEIIIVIGHEKEKIKNLIKPNKKIIFAYNKDFRNGMASSIKVGLSHLSRSSEAFFISLADMPKINQNIYNKQTEFFKRFTTADYVEENKFFSKFQNIKYFAHYDVSLKIFREYPILGVANKNFRHECHNKKYFDKKIRLTKVRCNTHPHQIHFELLSEHGIIGYIFLFYIDLSYYL